MSVWEMKFAALNREVSSERRAPVEPVQRKATKEAQVPELATLSSE